MWSWIKSRWRKKAFTEDWHLHNMYDAMYVLRDICNEVPTEVIAGMTRSHFRQMLAVLKSERPMKQNFAF